MAGKKKFLVDAEKLKAARKKAALSVEDLSSIAYTEIAEENPNSENPDVLSFSASDIQKYEKGGALIYADKLKRLSNLLDVDPKELVFFDSPYLFTSSIEFKTWCYFVNDISKHSNQIQGRFLFQSYSDLVSSCCKPMWDALSSSSAASSDKPPKNAKHNAVYTATRKLRLRKKDFEETKEVLNALLRQREDAIILSLSNRHIAELFKRNIRKHQLLLQVLKENVEQGEIQYSLSEIAQLTEYFATMTTFLEEARLQAEKEKQEIFYDVYGYGDEAEYFQDVINGYEDGEFYNSLNE